MNEKLRIMVDNYIIDYGLDELVKYIMLDLENGNFTQDKLVQLINILDYIKEKYV